MWSSGHVPCVWKEVKKIKGRNNMTSASVDGASKDSDISHTFSEKYKHLYNSVPYNINRMNDIKQDINDRLNVNRSNGYCVNVDNVINAVNRLKLGEI